MRVGPAHAGLMNSRWWGRQVGFKVSSEKRVDTVGILPTGKPLPVPSGMVSSKAFGRSEQRQDPAWWERTRGLCWWPAWAPWCFRMEDEANLFLCCIYLFWTNRPHISVSDFHRFPLACYGNINIQSRLLPFLCSIYRGKSFCLKCKSYSSFCGQN